MAGVQDERLFWSEQIEKSCDRIQPLAAVAICLLSMPIPADRRWVPVA